MAQVYRAGQVFGQPTRLTPHEVRTSKFAPRRRGLDPDQVRAFQALVADELNDLHQQVRMLGQENERLKRALRDWQIMHARECQPDEGHW